MVHWRWRAMFVCAVLALLVTVGAPRALFAHGHLKASSPAAGSRLAEAPTELRLTFSEAPELAESGVRLFTADGAEVRLGPLALAGSRTIVARVLAPPAPGEYRVVWRAVAADGHPTHGEYRFVVAGVAAAPSTSAGTAGQAVSTAAAGQAPGIASTAGPARSTAHARGAGEAATTGFDAASPAYAAIRFFLYLALITLIGTVAFRQLVLRRAASRLRGAAADALHVDAAAAAARVGALAAAALIPIALARLGAQAAAVRDVGGAMDAGVVRVLLAHTLWGHAWLLQLASALVAFGGFALVSRGRESGWLVAAIAAAGLALSCALAGHAAASSMPVLAVAADALHVLGAAGWLGSLAATLAAGVVAALRRRPAERAPAVAALVDAFSPTALSFAALTAMTGAFAAWLQIGHLPALTGTAYGRVVLVKLALVCGVGAAGAYNWLRVRPALGTDAGSARLKKSGMAELAVGVLVLLATAVLVGLPAPAGM